MSLTNDQRIALAGAMHLLVGSEFVVEETGEDFEFVKMVMHEGRLRIVLKREEPKK